MADKESDFTSIGIAVSTRSLLRQARKEGESYDHLVRRLLKLGEDEEEVKDLDWDGKLDWKEAE